MSNQKKFFKYIYLYDVNGEVLRAGLCGSGRLMVTPLAYCATAVLFSHLPVAFLHRD